MVAILNMWYFCYIYNFNFVIIGILVHENLLVYSKIVFLSGLEAKILPKA